jgi:hypothetical protein
MTNASADLEEQVSQNPIIGLPPLRPSWIHPVAIAIVAIGYGCLLMIFAYWITQKAVSLGEFDAELISDGDYFDADALAETDIRPDQEQPVQEAIQELDFALPQPLVMAPEIVPLPKKRDAAEKKRKVEKKRVSDRGAGRDDQRSAGQMERRFGMPGARGRGAGSTPATCLALVSASLRRHTPAFTSLGPGAAYVTMYVHVGGGISPVSASGSTPAHAALARQIVSASRGPAHCGEVFASQSFKFN